MSVASTGPLLLFQINIVLDRHPAYPTERGTAVLHFSAHVYCCQTVAHLRNYCLALVYVISTYSVLFLLLIGL